MDFDFILSLQGAPYLWWHQGEWDNSAPFYINGVKSKEEVFKYGINCAGVVNRYLLSNGYKIPSIQKYPGGTYAYYKIYKKNLLKFNSSDLARGDILLNRYKNKTMQGHVAIYLGENNIIEATADRGGEGCAI